MYLLSAKSQKKIREIKKFLLSKFNPEEGEIEIRDAKLPEYLFSSINPQECNPPPGLLTGVRIDVMKEGERYYKFYKIYGELAHLFAPPPKPEVGNVVSITGGEYKSMNLKGIVREVRKKTCVVETVVLGRLVKMVVNLNDVKVIKNKDNGNEEDS